MMLSLANRLLVAIQTRNTHASLAAECKSFGLADPPSSDDTGSKAERIQRRLEQMSDRDIARAAERAGAYYKDYEIEESALQFLEADELPLTEITRRDIAACFDSSAFPLSGQLGIIDLVARIFPLDGMEFAAFGLGPNSAEIRQHMVRNDDWTVLDLFEYLGALTGSRKRFFMLLQAAMHPLARRGSEQENLRDRLNAVLARDGWKLAISGYESHYPVYGVVPLGRGVQGKPKNLIFASNGPKPEIGFADAINNDIVILSHADSCLVYDRPISRAGLRWTELVEWWCAEQCPPGTTEEAARKLLGKRLRISLASDGERGLFDVYFRGLRPQLGDRLPALIPQVYLHYDPAVVSRLRHREPLPRQRMDFLLLLPNDGRVVIEVDGQQHFCEGDKPSLGRYSEMVRADRDLRLLGYEVYRFGANELVGPAAARNAVEFLEGLFRKHALEQPVRN